MIEASCVIDPYEDVSSYQTAFLAKKNKNKKKVISVTEGQNT